MITRYFYNGLQFSFEWNIDNNNALLIRCGSNTWHIKCNTRAGYAITINKCSVSSNDGARGVFSFISDCIKNDFMLCYVNAIINKFCF